MAALSGVRVWLSGSMAADGGGDLREFVRRLARAVFGEGGMLLHGFHPAVTPMLLEEARPYRGPGREPLHLMVSTYFRFRAWSVCGMRWRRGLGARVDL